MLLCGCWSLNITVKLFWIKIESLFWITFGNTDCSKTRVERDAVLCGFVPFFIILFYFFYSFAFKTLLCLESQSLSFYISIFMYGWESICAHIVHIAMLTVQSTEAVLLVSLNIIMAVTVKIINEKSSEERPAEQLVKWEVVWVSVMASAAPAYHRPQTLSPVKTKIFHPGASHRSQPEETEWKGGWRSKVGLP